ncbi:unnamed protein product, partial [Polarella glacialis]
MPVISPASCPDPSFGSDVAHECTSKKFGMSCWAYCKTGSGAAKKYVCYMGGSGSTLDLFAATSNISCTGGGGRLLRDSGRQLVASCTSASATTAGLDVAGGGYSFATCVDLADGSACIVTCADGYNMSEATPPTWTCSSAALSGVKPTCVPVPCTYNLPSGVGVSHNCSGVGTGSSCIAGCGEGYALASGTTSESFACNWDGNFNGSAPSCVALPCATLHLSAYYQSDCANITTGSSCYVSCGNGYELSGNITQQTCEANGTFSGARPSCMPNLCTSGVPDDADLNTSSGCSGLRTGESCNVVCANGYTGNSASFSCAASGFVNGTKPTCTALNCSVPQDLAAGGRTVDTCSGLSYGEQCLVGCAFGYQLTANASAAQWTCDVNASASGEVALTGSMPQCEVIPCLYGLPAGDDFSSNCSTAGFGQSCLMSCATGYQGTATWLSCGEGQLFSGQAPSCSTRLCPHRTFPAGIQDTCGSTEFQGSCWTSCAAGYRSEGVASAEWTCNASDMALEAYGIALIGSNPSCQPTPCSFGLPQGRGYSHNCSGAATGQACTVSCSLGYNGTEVKQLVCDADEALKGVLPGCVATATLALLVVHGKMSLTVSNAAEFIVDLAAKAGVAQSLASAAQVDVSQ